MTDTDNMIKRFEQIYTGAIADIMDEMGLKNFALPHTLQPLVPGQRVTGTALTVYGVPTIETDPAVIYEPLLKMLGDVQPGQVIVSQANDHTAAHMGELSAETAKYRGCRGAVIYGGIRDTDYMMNIGFAAYSLYKTPIDVMGRWKMVDYNVPIQIENVRIFPGDYVVGDRDGVLIIPQDSAVEVLEKAEEVVNTENLVRRDILNGIHPLDAYHQHGRF